MNLRLKTILPGLLLFLLSLCVGLAGYKDYGVAWDEPVQRDIAAVSYNYVFKGDTSLETYRDRDYGVAFELPLLAVEKALGLSDTSDIYLFRHLAVHCFFLLAAFVAYFLFHSLYRSRLLACLGFLILVLNPRLYAHSFFNSKDIPFMCMFLISLSLAYKAFLKDRAWLYFVLGLSLGYTTAIRIMGIMLIVFILLFFFFDLVAAWRSGKRGKVLMNALIFLAGTILMLYASWPTLWRDPLNNFISCLQSFSHYVWDSEVLFMGKVYTGSTLPWYYIPVWFGITTPLLWLLAGLSAIGVLLSHFVRQPLRFLQNNKERNFLLYLLCFTAPVTAVIVLDSVVYDDWRHLYFIYPPFVLLLIFALSKLRNKKLRIAAYTACAAQLICTAGFMYRSHPVQQVYFNALVPKQKDYAKKNFELDYWGASYKQGLDYLLKNEKDSIRVFWSLHPVINNVNILSSGQRGRIKLVDRGDYPYFFITNYRGRNPKDRFDHPMPFSVIVQNNTVLGVYRVEAP
jgi:hypothetical protein